MASLPGRNEVIRRFTSEARVKCHKFLPSGREIWTVVGSLGDQLVQERQPYCTCGNFHFAVLGGKKRSCRHLDAVRTSKYEQAYDKLELEDADYGRFLYLLMKSIHAQFGSK